MYVLLFQLGLKSEGLYRVPANQDEMVDLILKFEANPGAHFSHFTNDPHTLAGTLKCFFQKLPQPLVSNFTSEKLVSVQGK